ncbi:imidazole glycerol phosphate synthase subunit HisH [Desulfobacterales bacterium HSG17]|nr:imidazole glycerol phosphate synthase subunit HisH [Desulfobacterales bacterium HSG17]
MFTNKKHIRIIPKLDIKGPNLVKGVQLEGLRVLGSPEDFSLKYYLDGADELIYIDLVASLYGRSNLVEIVEQTANQIFIPLTVGGGIRSVEDMRSLLHAGADKLAINTALFEDISLLKKGATTFGSQCMVVYVEAKHIGDNQYVCMHTNARENSGENVLAWIQEVEKAGAGEIFLTFVDTEGTGNGVDYEFVSQVVQAVQIPVIINGGIGTRRHIIKTFQHGADAVSAASIFHYHRLEQLKNENCNRGEGNTSYIELSRSANTSFLKDKIFPESIDTLKKQFDPVDFSYRMKSDHDAIPSIAGKGKPLQPVIVDYGMGNIFSLGRAIKTIGRKPIVSADSKIILNADYLILPGVGAFPEAMKNLEIRDLIEPIIDFASSGKPLLGICLGMQLLLSESEEMVSNKGLGLIPGCVKKLFKDIFSDKLKLPHFGWNNLSVENACHFNWDKTIFEGISKKDAAYFVHSYACYPDDEKSVLSTTLYGKERFCSAVQKDNIIGCQFHPELSGPAGLIILNNFFKKF